MNGRMDDMKAGFALLVKNEEKHFRLQLIGDFYWCSENVHQYDSTPGYLLRDSICN